MFAKSMVTEQLADALKRRVNDNNYEPMTYEEIDAIIGGDARGRHRWIVASAIRIAQKATGRLLGSVRGVGVKVLTIDEQAAEPAAALRHVARVSRKRLSRLAKVEYDKLPNEAKQQHNIAASVVGAISLMTDRRRLEAVAKKIEGEKKLDFDSTLKLFEMNKQK